MSLYFYLLFAAFCSPSGSCPVFSSRILPSSTRLHPTVSVFISLPYLCRLIYMPSSRVRVCLVEWWVDEENWVGTKHHYPESVLCCQSHVPWICIVSRSHPNPQVHAPVLNGQLLRRNVRCAILGMDRKAVARDVRTLNDNQGLLSAAFMADTRVVSCFPMIVLWIHIL